MTKKRLEDVLMTSSKYVLRTSWKMKNCYAKDILKTSWRHVLKTPWRQTKCLPGISNHGRTDKSKSAFNKFIFQKSIFYESKANPKDINCHPIICIFALFWNTVSQINWKLALQKTGETMKAKFEITYHANNRLYPHWYLIYI